MYDHHLLTTPAAGTQSTASCVLAAEPTVGASAVTTSHLLSNSVQLNWTRGNGTNCIVVCRALSAVTTPPIDGQTYTANAAYGLGSTTAPGEYIVYQGTGTSVVVTGIIPNTTYYFAVFEMNGSGLQLELFHPRGTRFRQCHHARYRNLQLVLWKSACALRIIPMATWITPATVPAARPAATRLDRPR